MSYPIWATPPDLGTYPEGTSLTENSIVLAFGDTASAPLQVSLLNGALPPGITWRAQAYQITLSGFLRSVPTTQTYHFTFRLSNGVNIADRTFQLSITNVQLQRFAWVTDATVPLSYVYDVLTSQVTIRAESDPITVITYEILNPVQLSQGLTLNSSSGVLTIDYAWKPLTYYTAPKDRVITSSGLFSCEISGNSGSSVPPQGAGYFVDSDYPAWQPERFYTVNSVVHADLGKIYLCVSQGFSGVQAPQGTNSSISDNTVVWSYQDQAPVWLRVTPNTTQDQTFTVVAQSGTQSIAEQFTVQLVSTPYEPLWITPEGALPDAFTKLSYSVQLQAVDPDQSALIWSSVDLPEWLQLSNVGQLSGIAPSVDQNTTYQFSVQISDGIGISSRSFQITVVENVIEFSWIIGPDLGVQPDGVMSSIQLSAQSTRSDVFITYGLYGGQLPPGLILNTQSGAVEGFVEFHAQNKTYHWDVLATDGVENLIQQFTVTVVCQMLGAYWTLQVPIWGTDSTQWQTQNSEGVVSTTDLYLPEVSGWGRNDAPHVTIISGISGANAQTVRELIQPHMHNFVLQMHDLILLPGADSQYQVLAVRVQDQDTVKLWRPNTTYVKGERVSNTRGLRYVALNSGVSGVTSPQGEGTQQKDNQITWSWDSVVNNQTSVTSPLPWYPYRTYVEGEVITIQGGLYRAAQAGRSGGSQTSAFQLQDGSVVWQPLQADAPHDFSNVFYPADLLNMRSALIQNLGWSSAVGSGFTADVQVSFTGEITQVIITNPGENYYRTPQVQIQGTGSGAQVELMLGVVGVEILNGGVSWVSGVEFELNLGSATPARIQIQSVNSSGTVLAMTVLDPGEFSQVPSEQIRLSNAENLILDVKLKSGIISCVVKNPGSAYTSGSTQISAQGLEWSPSQQSFVSTSESQIPLAHVTKSYAESVNLSQVFNPFASELIDVRAITATIQGLEYQGSVICDQDTCTWDSDATRLVDATPATALEWDQNDTRWDQRLTEWDNAQLVWPQYTQTVFDQDRTIWDYYRTILDQTPARMNSAYSRTWVWWMGQPWRGGSK